jgi:hypothetical protein
MKIGTDQIRYEIIKRLKKYDAYLKGINRGDFADELAGEIIKLFGDDMRNKEWDLIHSFPAELAAIVDRLERGLGLRNMMRDDRAQEVYRWIIDQEKEGKSLKVFISWALDAERARFVGKYKNNPDAIKTDYQMAFGSQQRSSADVVLI